MPNYKAHATAGLAAGALATLFEYQMMKERDPNAKFDPLKMTYNLFSGLAGAILPDKLEPAFHPHHRKFFHSYTAGAGLAYTKTQIDDFLNQYPDLKYPTYAFFLGYASHLILDFRTPKSLPLI